MKYYCCSTDHTILGNVNLAVNVEKSVDNRPVGDPEMYHECIGYANSHRMVL